jgi:hypothetical protein
MFDIIRFPSIFHVKWVLQQKISLYIKKRILKGKKEKDIETRMMFVFGDKVFFTSHFIYPGIGDSDWDARVESYF